MLPLGGDQMCNQSYLFLFMRFLITVQVFHTGQAIIQYKGIQSLFLFSNEFNACSMQDGMIIVSYHLRCNYRGQTRPSNSGCLRPYRQSSAGRETCHGQTRGVPNSVIRPVANQGNRHLKISRQARGVSNLLIANMGKLEARLPAELCCWPAPYFTLIFDAPCDNVNSD